MKIQGLKNVNITVLFSNPLNPLLVSQEQIVGFFTTGDPQKDLLNFVEAPGLKIAIFPNQKKEISFQGPHLIVSDKSESDVANISKSSVISDFRKVFNTNAVDKNKIVAYGFNYDLLVELDSTQLTDLVGSKITQFTQLPGVEIKNAGVTIVFEKNSISYNFMVTPTGTEKMFLAHFNAHFNSNVIPDDVTLNKQLIDQFEEFMNIIKSL